MGEGRGEGEFAPKSEVVFARVLSGVIEKSRNSHWRTSGHLIPASRSFQRL
jgi:hypothetical protein